MQSLSTKISEIITQYRTVIFFLFSGGTVALFQLLLYTFLSRVLDVQYLIASSISFVVAVAFSFLMQKFLVFQNTSTQAIPKQFLYFSIMAIMNLNVNGGLMIFFVEYLHIHDIVAQMIVMVTIAVWSFFVYRHVIFKHH